jgi:hypothetical protein
LGAIVGRFRKPNNVAFFFLGLPVAAFRSGPQHFSVFAAITDGEEIGMMQLAVRRLDTDDVIFSLGNSGTITVGAPTKSKSRRRILPSKISGDEAYQRHP